MDNGKNKVSEFSQLQRLDPFSLFHINGTLYMKVASIKKVSLLEGLFETDGEAVMNANPTGKNGDIHVNFIVYKDSLVPNTKKTFSKIDLDKNKTDLNKILLSYSIGLDGK